MRVKKVRYTEHIPGKVDYHYIAFLTASGEVLLMGHFLTAGHANKVANGIMSGKKSSSTFIPFPGVFIYEREKYDENFVNMVKAGEITNCIVVENAPESIEELRHFAGAILKEPPN